MATGVVIILVCCVIFAEHDAGELPPHEIVACVADAKTPLGRLAIFRAMVTNTGSEAIVVGVLIHTGTDMGPLSPTRWGGQWTPECRPIVEEIMPGATRLIDGSLYPGWGAFPGEYAYRVEVCLVPVKTFMRKKNERKDHLSYKKAYERDPCTAIGGSAIEYSGTFFIEEPEGRDEEYFGRYKIATYFDKNAETAKEEKARHRADMMAHKDEMRHKSSIPIETLRSKEWWSALYDNSYSAQLNGAGDYINDVDKFVDNALRYFRYPHNGRYREDDLPVALARNRAEKALYYTRLSDMAWQRYLYESVLGYLGTREEEKGIEALERVATSCPDCTVRAIAKRILDVYCPNGNGGSGFEAKSRG